MDSLYKCRGALYVCAGPSAMGYHSLLSRNSFQVSWSHGQLSWQALPRRYEANQPQLPLRSSTAYHFCCTSNVSIYLRNCAPKSGSHNIPKKNPTQRVPLFLTFKILIECPDPIELTLDIYMYGLYVTSNSQGQRESTRDTLLTFFRSDFLPQITRQANHLPVLFSLSNVLTTRGNYSDGRNILIPLPYSQGVIVIQSL